MRSNTQNTNSNQAENTAKRKTVTMQTGRQMMKKSAIEIIRAGRKAAGLLTLGITAKQWAASLMICAMMSSVFALPVRAALMVNEYAASTQMASKFEPVNLPEPLWKQMWTDLNATTDGWLMSLSPVNVTSGVTAALTGDSDDEKVKAKNKIEKGGKDKSAADKSASAGESGKIKKADALMSVADSSADSSAKNRAGENKSESAINKTIAPDLSKTNPAKSSPSKSVPLASPTPATNPKPGTIVSTSEPLEPLNVAPPGGGGDDTGGGGDPGTPPPSIWSNSLWKSLFTPENNLGSPAGQARINSPSRGVAGRTRERTGTGNFSFDIPVASLPGRGLNASVGITYNSQLWNKSGETSPVSYTYNVDRNWLAPGFNLSYGYLDYHYYGSGGYYSLTSPNGTRHLLFYKGASAANELVTYESADGDFVQIVHPNNQTLGGTDNIWAKFPDGSTVSYGASDNSGRKYAREVIDRNGNYISISYLQGDHKGRVDKITDTLNREIIFHYDNNANVAEKKLVAVSVPGFGSEPRRQAIRFYYGDVPFSPQSKFNGDVSVFRESAVPATMKVLRFVYYPGTKTGYKYDYSSVFGMIYKITELTGMEVTDSTSLSVTGDVSSEGQPVNQTTYNYPVNSFDVAGRLNDVPKYNRRYDDWQGRDTSTPNFYTFQETEDPALKEKTIKVTAPDGSVSVTKSHLKPDETVNGVYTQYWDDGLTKETSTTDATGKVFGKQIFTWQQGDQANGRKNPRPLQIESINEVGQSTLTTYEYDAFNNPKTVTEYGFPDGGGNRPELKRTETTYVTGAGWLYVRLIRLPEEVKTIVDGETVSKVKYEYDDSANIPNTPGTYPPNVTPRNDVVHHNSAYNPGINHSFSVCGAAGCTMVLVDYPESYYKGNVTKVTAYSNAALLTDPNASVTTMKYDLVGNAVAAGLNCCNEKTWDYVKTNEYAYPVSVTKGTDVQLTTRAEYDYNTGLVTKTTDENLQETGIEYEPDTLRQRKVIYPNGGYTLTEYSDKLPSDPYRFGAAFVKTTTTLDTNKTVRSYSYLDGHGASIRSATETQDGWSIAVSEYDSLGRPKKTYNPYNGTAPIAAIPGDVKWTEVSAYDSIGRVAGIKLQDLTTVDTNYIRETVTYTAPGSQTRTGTAITVKDQTGKERRQIIDALGRVVRVDEPDVVSNSLGSVTAPNQPTHYYYDGNDNLTKVIQSDGSITQERRFKYDSLSRLTHEKQVEADATLDIDGFKGAADAATRWTKVLKYNVHGLLTDAIDARGVNTHFDYDGLNRIWKIKYSDDTPKVTYTYDQTRPNSFNKGALTRVETAQNDINPRADTPDTATELDYDRMGGVIKHRQSIASQTYNLEYGYNLAGQLISEKYPSGKIVNMNYDTGGRLSNINDASRTYLNNLQYQGKANSLSSMTMGNGTIQNFVMNDRLQMESQELKRGAEVLQKYDYGYGVDVGGVRKNNGQLAEVVSHIGTAKQWTQQFNYDSVGRLAEASEYRGDSNANVLSYKQTFDYDRFGNMYRKSARNPTTGQQNPLPYNPIEEADISKSTNRFTSNTQYDEAGNVVQDNKFRSINFSYDANGRMFRTSNIDNTNQANSVYDAAGQRVATQVDGVWTFFVYDAMGKMIAEYGGLSSSDGGGVKYVMQDWQGSTRAIVSNSGFVHARMDYTAFGEEISGGVGQRTTTQGFGANNNLNQKYALTERDKATGLDHTWFRKNENRAGRWTSPDPYNGSMNLGNPQSFNRYSYVENQPTNFVDPSGLLIIIAHYYGCRIREGGGLICDGVSYTIFDDNPGGGSTGGGVEAGGGGGGGDETNCEKFVNIVEGIAKSAKNARDFADQMAKRFLGVNGATISELRRAGGIPSSEFGSSGFKEQFRDKSNQVRHFTAGLTAGFLLGANSGYTAMGLNESHGWGMVEPNDDEKADIALNAVSTALGATVVNPTPETTVDMPGGYRSEMRREKKVPANPGYTDLADRIRKRVCE